MLNIDSLQKGVVIDHIEVGKSMEIYRALELDKLDCSVAIIKNARSKKTARKDIIKIEDRIDIDLDILGFIDPNITVNIIDNGEIVEKKHLSLPQRIVNVARCKNPRCITSVEQELDHVFLLTDEARGIYRCAYCEHQYQDHK
jgi:aspartate carbamoyltransferase regulatory subunit